MFVPAETEGTQMRVIPADAHWQLGRTENHGGWFDRVLSKVIDEHSPKNKSGFNVLNMHMSRTK